MALAMEADDAAPVVQPRPLGDAVTARIAAGRRGSVCILVAPSLAIGTESLRAVGVAAALDVSGHLASGGRAGSVTKRISPAYHPEGHRTA